MNESQNASNQIGRPAAVGFGLLALGAGLIAAMQYGLSGYANILAAFTLLHVMLAVSLQITNGFTGLFSLGHPAFMTVGGYIAAVLTFPASRKSFMLDLPLGLANVELTLLPAVLLGGLGAGITALVVGFPVLRLRGHYLAVATLGFIIVVQVLINNANDWTRGPLGLNGLPGYTNLWWCFGFTALTVFIAWRLKHSSLGRAMMAVRENELAAACAGVSPARAKMTAFVLGAVLAGIAGGLWVHLVTAITPDSFSILLAFMLVVMVVVGGSGSITGAVIAALAVSLVSEAIKPVQEAIGAYGLSQIVTALAVLLVLIFRPTGLFGHREPAVVAGVTKKRAE